MYTSKKNYLNGLAIRGMDAFVSDYSGYVSRRTTDLDKPGTCSGEGLVVFSILDKDRMRLLSQKFFQSLNIKVLVMAHPSFDEWPNIQRTYTVFHNLSDSITDTIKFLHPGVKYLQSHAEINNFGEFLKILKSSNVISCKITTAPPKNKEEALKIIKLIRESHYEGDIILNWNDNSEKFYEFLWHGKCFYLRFDHGEYSTDLSSLDDYVPYEEFL